jgi:hypothetical protein
MKRTLLTVLASALLVLALPASALAHGHHHHAHKRHAKHARVLRFGAVNASAPSTTAPAVQVTPTSQNAGTVLSFTNNVLTIELNDKSTVSGKVTEDTELRCQSATPESNGDDENDGDEPNGENNQAQNNQHEDEKSLEKEHARPGGGGEFAAQHGDVVAHRANSQREGQTQKPCTTEALQKGTVVVAAELKLSSAGAVWEQVDLIH